MDEGLGRGEGLLVVNKKEEYSHPIPVPAIRAYA